MNDELSIKLKKEQDLILDIVTRIEKNEERLSKIAQAALSTEYLHQPFKSIMEFIHILVGLPLLLSSQLVSFFFGGEIGEAVAILVAWAFILVIVGAIPKWITTEKINNSNKNLENNLNMTMEKLLVLLRELLPEIHNLYLFDVETVKNKTSARLLDITFIRKYIIDKELNEGRIEKVQFKDQQSKTEKTLYKSLIPHNNNDMEHIELQID